MSFPDKQGTTPLMLASDGANYALVRLLLASGAEVGAVDTEGRTALQRAAQAPASEDREAVMQLLLANP